MRGPDSEIVRSSRRPRKSPRMNRLRLYKAALLVAIAAATQPLSHADLSAAQHPEIEKRIDSLLSKMTLEEKLGQLQTLDGDADGNYRPEQVELIRKGQLGSTLNIRGAARTNKLQHIAMDESRLKIPVLFGFDVIHGYRTILPVPLAVASTWDPASAEQAAAIAASEASSAGVRWTYAPMVDIARDPRWGRIVEGAGEDPFLGAVMARAQVLGFQGADYGAPDKIVACAKHFVGYGAAEAGRDYNTTDIPERTLREVYLPPFKAARDAGVGTFMSAFNDLNGVPATANQFTLRKVLREEWNFDGFVVSDYESVRELMNHGVAADQATAALEAITAGTDVEMVSRLYKDNLPTLIRDGKLQQSVIDEAVRRVLRIKLRLGLFERPYVDEARERSVMGSADHRKAARAIAARSFVLLKNDRQILPLRKDLKSIAVIGPLADDQVDLIGSWSGDGNPADAISLLSGIKAKISPETRIQYVKGCDISGDSTSGFDKARQAAREAEAVIVAVGESADMSGEAASRASIDLPGKQLELVKALVETGKPIAVVLMNGRPLTIDAIATREVAILETWFPGIEAGNAIADVLFGDVNPGGKLPVTFPRVVGQVPIYYNHMNTGRPPDPKNKYTSKYLDVPVTPLFPFGFGLSYSQFKLSDLRLSSRRLAKGDLLKVTAQLENVGKYAGDEVVQLYIRRMSASVTRPVRELKGFARVSLRPGEKRSVEFTLGPQQLAFYDRDMRFVVEPGSYRVFVGTSSEGGLEDGFEVVSK
jgi:beta-glucosidase